MQGNILGFVTTDQAAALLGKCRGTLFNHFSRDGHCYGVVPVRFSRVLLWPRDGIEAVLARYPLHAHWPHRASLRAQSVEPKGVIRNASKAGTTP